MLALAQIKSYKLKFCSLCQFHIDTAQNKWYKLQAQMWFKMEHPNVDNDFLYVLGLFKGIFGLFNAYLVVFGIFLPKTVDVDNI